MSNKSGNKKEFLVAILKDKSDFAILQEQGWYRIPVQRAPRRWPPRWLAFYQPKAFGNDAYRVRYYGEVSEIQIVKRKDLFPNELPSARSDQEYYRINLKSLEERAQPIPSTRPRRLVFIPTTWLKFCLAEQINDLFDDSPLEDRLWTEFKGLQIAAERQWGAVLAEHFFYLDFVLFCNQGQVDIETDGDTWHAQRDRIPKDNERDNCLESLGWHVLRFNSKQIIEQMRTHCLDIIQSIINKLGGLTEEGMIPRVFYSSGGQTIQQLSLFDRADQGYEIDEAMPIEMD